jgi:hypothetical protein
MPFAFGFAVLLAFLPACAVPQRGPGAANSPQAADSAVSPSAFTFQVIAKSGDTIDGHELDSTGPIWDLSDHGEVIMDATLKNEAARNESFSAVMTASPSAKRLLAYQGQMIGQDRVLAIAGTRAINRKGQALYEVTVRGPECQSGCNHLYLDGAPIATRLPGSGLMLSDLGTIAGLAKVGPERFSFLSALDRSKLDAPVTNIWDSTHSAFFEPGTDRILEVSTVWGKSPGDPVAYRLSSSQGKVCDTDFQQQPLDLKGGVFAKTIPASFGWTAGDRRPIPPVTVHGKVVKPDSIYDAHWDARCELALLRILTDVVVPEKRGQAADEVSATYSIYTKAGLLLSAKATINVAQYAIPYHSIPLAGFRDVYVPTETFVMNNFGQVAFSAHIDRLSGIDAQRMAIILATPKPH